MSLSKRLPAPLSERIASASAALYSRQGREFDVAVAGIPFMLATIGDLPQSVETIKIRKDQFDAENDPGEQSLTGWWRRSQASWHEGAGALYQESLESNSTGNNGFYRSSGIDVFTQGQLTLLKKMDTATVAAATVYSRIRSSASGFSAVGNGALHTSPAASGAYASLHAPATKTIVDGLVSDNYFYDVASDGTLYEGTVASPGTATTWPLGGTPSRLCWGKHRLWVIGGRDIWQPDLSDAAGTAQAAIFTNPNKGWTYTCLAEGPSAMYFGGHDGFASSIQAITFDDGGGIPTLSGATITATLPGGELVQEIAVLAGQFIGIGTNRGFRLGVLGNGGAITYGPLLIQPDGITGCTSVSTQGRFFLVAFSTASDNALAYRVDTGTQLSEGVFPYAADFDCGIPGSVTSMVPSGDATMTCTTSDGQVWYQSETEYVDSGWLESGRIRFRTTELKAFRFLDIGTQPLAGNISCGLIKEGGSTLPLGSLTRQGEVASETLAITAESMRHASIKVTLTPDAAGTAAPIINSILLRALPAVPPQRLITLPLLCYDQEQARSGQRYGGSGYAKDRLTALMLIEDLAEPVIFQDFSTTGEGQQVTIESLRFVQTAPAPPYRSEGAGGVLVLELRTVGQ